jgi:cupin fold WbuC family metalloprotein
VPGHTKRSRAELIRHVRAALATSGYQGKANGDDGAVRLPKTRALSYGREVEQSASMTQSKTPQLVGSEQLAPLLEAATASRRKRSHLLLHADQQDQVQRLLIALEPESYVRPHVHGEQWEMIVLLRGRFDFLIFDPQAELLQRLAMSIASPVVQIPRGTWHSGVALAPETLVLEIKPGPYRPNEFAPWAPEEGEPASGAFVHWAAGARVGSKWRSQVA